MSFAGRAMSASGSTSRRHSGARRELLGGWAMSEQSDQEGAGEPSKWGKGKTDPATWFKPGGKPGPGRPKGSKNAKTVWAEINAEKTAIKIAGKPQTVTKGQLKYHQLATKAGNGELKAIAMAIGLDEKWSPHEAPPPTPKDTAADRVVLDALIAIQKKFGNSEGEQS